jgi:hypothetical protein
MGELTYKNLITIIVFDLINLSITFESVYIFYIYSII